GIAAGGDGAKPGQEVERLLRDGDRIPAQLADRQLALVAARPGANETGVDLLEAARVQRRGPDAIEPSAPVAGAWGGEGGAAQLLGIKPVGGALRRVAPDRQRTLECLGLVGAEESGLVGQRDGRGGRVRAALAGFVEHG